MRTWQDIESSLSRRISKVGAALAIEQQKTSKLTADVKAMKVMLERQDRNADAVLSLHRAIYDIPLIGWWFKRYTLGDDIGD